MKTHFVAQFTQDSLNTQSQFWKRLKKTCDLVRHIHIHSYISNIKRIISRLKIKGTSLRQIFILDMASYMIMPVFFFSVFQKFDAFFFQHFTTLCNSFKMHNTIHNKSGPRTVFARLEDCCKGLYQQKYWLVA